MESCVPTTALKLKPTVNRKYVDVNSAKPLTVTYTLRLKGAPKRLRLRDMGVQVTLPPGSVVRASRPQLSATQGETVTWYPLAFSGTRMNTFRLKATVPPPFTNANTTGLVFSSAVVQNAYDLASAPYCMMPAQDTAVVIKTA